MTTEAAERLGTRALLNMLGDWATGDGASLHGRLGDAFRQAITTGVLPAGVVLPSERTLARSLGVSRSTITATLGELKSEGLLDARHGSGTRVAGDGVGGDGGGIDLAASSPADARALPDVDVDLDALMQAGSRHGYTPAGLPELRAAVAERFTTDGLETEADQILITNGAQHALALAFAHFAGPGDRMIVDEPTYPGVVDLLAARQLEPLPLARVEGGIDVAGLGRLVRANDCRLAYLQTSVHNPTGFVADDADIRRLADTVTRLGLTVIEDLVLGDLRFDGRRPRPLAALAPATVVVGSVSKLGWGGLRIGWLRASGRVVDQMVRSRLADDLGSSIPSQVISAALLSNFDVMAESRQRTLARRAGMAQELLGDLCPGWQVAEPRGGLSLWIDLGSPVAATLAHRSAAEGVTIATGDAASVDGNGSSFIRLCFDRPEPQLREGLQRLARAWRTMATGA